MIDEIIEELSGIIGKSCWICKHRNKENWYEDEFCHFYPELWEREILKGRKCQYFEFKWGEKC